MSAADAKYLGQMAYATFRKKERGKGGSGGSNEV
jgi:hypothetical protein